MNTETPASDSGGTGSTNDTRVFVEIPRARRGQGYRAPRNFEHRAVAELSRFIVWLLCAALIIAPAFVIGLICFMPGSNELQSGLAWLWIVMFLLTESIAVFAGVGIYREAVGIAGTRYEN